MSFDKSWSRLERSVFTVFYTWQTHVAKLRNGMLTTSDTFGDASKAVQFRLSVAPSFNDFNIILHPTCDYQGRYMFTLCIPQINANTGSDTYHFPRPGNIKVFGWEDVRINFKIKCTIIIEKVFEVSICKVIDDFGTLVNVEKFSDVTIETAGGHKIRAHKIILSARSNVFAAMFNHDMVENQMNCVKIEDFSQEVVMDMLRYMYTGIPTTVKDVAEGLFVAADKYQLDLLKEMCLKSLNDNITTENAARVFKLAEVYKENGLLLKSVKFIKTHAESVAETPNWKNLLKTEKELIIRKFFDPIALIAMDDEEDLEVAKKRKSE